MVDIMNNENKSLYNTLSEWCEITKRNKRVNITNNAYQSYLHSNDTRLSDVYDNYSNAKAYAYSTIINEMNDVGGYGFTIISYNVNMFTCGYVVHSKYDRSFYFIRHTAYYRDCVRLG